MVPFQNQSTLCTPTIALWVKNHEVHIMVKNSDERMPFPDSVSTAVAMVLIISSYIPCAMSFFFVSIHFLIVGSFLVRNLNSRIKFELFSSPLNAKPHLAKYLTFEIIFSKHCQLSLLSEEICLEKCSVMSTHCDGSVTITSTTLCDSLILHVF